MISTIIIIITTAGWTMLMHGSDLVPGLAITIITALLSLNLARHYTWSNIQATLFSSILTLLLFGIEHSAALPDIGLVATTALLTLALFQAWYNYHLAPNFFTLIATILLVSLWIWHRNAPVVISNVSKAPQSNSVQKFKRVVNALGGDQHPEATRELEARFGLPDSDTWKNGLGNKIPDTGPWPLSVMLESLPDDGNALSYGLWGNSVNRLGIADTGDMPLRPLVDCRNSVRNLFGKTTQYTPFFQADDFSNPSDSFADLEGKIYHWHPDVIESQSGCDTKIKSSDTLINWINKCFADIGGKYKEDPGLLNIKSVGKACEAVKFIDN